MTRISYTEGYSDKSVLKQLYDLKKRNDECIETVNRVEDTVEILNGEIENKQDTLIAGDNITIVNNVISVEGLTPDVDKAYVDAGLATKQDTLVSGTNIKTVNGNSLLGSGNIDVSVTIDDVLSTASENPVQNKVVTNALNGKQAIGDYATNTALQNGLAGKQNTLSTAQMNAVNSGITSTKVGQYDGYASQIAGKQDTLVSGTNIKTINNQPLLGSGNIDIQGGGTVTVDSALSTTSTNPVQNRVITNALNDKQDALSTAQQNAVNSGITSAKVSTYDGYATGKQNALSTAQMNAVNSGITSAKVSTYDGYASTIAGKQDALSTAQMNAVNSGVTSSKVSTYDGYASLIAGKQNALQTAQITVPASGGNVSVTGMTATAFVIVSPDPSSFDVYATAGCRCTAQVNGSLTFAVDETATASMTVNVGWFA